MLSSYDESDHSAVRKLLPNSIQKRIDAKHPILGQRKSVRAKCRRPMDGDAPRALERPLRRYRAPSARSADGDRRRSADGDVRCRRRPVDDDMPHAFASPLDANRCAAARRARGRRKAKSCKLSASAGACPAVRPRVVSCRAVSRRRSGAATRRQMVTMPRRADGVTP